MHHLSITTTCATPESFGWGGPTLTTFFSNFCIVHYKKKLSNYKQHLLLIIFINQLSPIQCFPILLWSFRYFGGLSGNSVLPVNLGTGGFCHPSRTLAWNRRSVEAPQTTSQPHSYSDQWHFNFQKDTFCISPVNHIDRWYERGFGWGIIISE